MANRYVDDEPTKPTFKTPPTSQPTGDRNVRSRFSIGQPCFCHVVHDILEREFSRSVPRYSEDKGPTIILESRDGEPGELQRMAALLDALGKPLRHAVKRMFCDSNCGHIAVAICSSDIFLAKIIAGRLDHSLRAYNVANYGLEGHAGLSVTYGDQHLASI